MLFEIKNVSLHSEISNNQIVMKRNAPFVLTMKGPSHLGSSLPRDYVRAVRTRTRSPSLNSLGMTVWSRHAFVWTWYLFRACKAKTGSPWMRSFEVGSSTSGTADETVRGDPCFISCGVMASDPYRRRKGVNPVALHSVVFSAQTASGHSAGAGLIKLLDDL